MCPSPLLSWSTLGFGEGILSFGVHIVFVVVIVSFELVHDRSTMLGHEG